MKNIKLLEEYIEAMNAHCPKCNQVLVAGNGGKCSSCGENLELILQSKPHISYSWKTGIWYGGVPVGWVFLVGFFLGVCLILAVMKIAGIL
jgi:tRNA(Ile2) C34 agmatinyltransferase TiaS